MRQVCDATLASSGLKSTTNFARLHHRGEWSNSEIKLLAIGMAVILRSRANEGSLATKQRRIAILQGTEGRKRLFVVSVPRKPNDCQSAKGFVILVLGLRKLFA